MCPANTAAAGTGACGVAVTSTAPTSQRLQIAVGEFQLSFFFSVSGSRQTWMAGLDREMAAHAKKTKLPDKLVPPDDVLTAELEERIDQKVRETLTERILREAGLDDQVEDTIAKAKTPTAAALAKGIKMSFKQKSDREWGDHIEAEAKKRTLKIHPSK
jgi:hypothetical protein